MTVASRSSDLGCQFPILGYNDGCYGLVRARGWAKTCESPRQTPLRVRSGITKGAVHV